MRVGCHAPSCRDLPNPGLCIAGILTIRATQAAAKENTMLSLSFLAWYLPLSQMCVLSLDLNMLDDPLGLLDLLQLDQSEGYSKPDHNATLAELMLSWPHT